MNIVSRWIGSFISKLIMHSQNIPLIFSKGSIEEDWHEMATLCNVDIKSDYLNSMQGARIHFCEFNHKEKSEESKKLIINVMAAGDFYENHAHEYILQARAFPDTTIASFNFRNVQKSDGIAYCEDDWIEDLLAVIEHYRQKNYPLSSMLMTGHSLGGAVAILTAAKLYAEDSENNKIKLIADRTFSSITEFILYSILKAPGMGLLSALLYGSLFSLLSYPIGISMAIGMLGLCLCYPKGSAFILRPWISTFMTLTFGKLDALSKYLSLPEETKDYITANDDGFIKKLSGLHYGLKTHHSHQSKKEAIIYYRSKPERNFINSIYAHCTPLKYCTAMLTHVDGRELLRTKINRLLP